MAKAMGHMVDWGLHFGVKISPWELHGKMIDPPYLRSRASLSQKEKQFEQTSLWWSPPICSSTWFILRGLVATRSSLHFWLAILFFHVPTIGATIALFMHGDGVAVVNSLDLFARRIPTVSLWGCDIRLLPKSSVAAKNRM